VSHARTLALFLFSGTKKTVFVIGNLQLHFTCFLAGFFRTASAILHLVALLPVFGLSLQTIQTIPVRGLHPNQKVRKILYLNATGGL
jgi:hypothetical protein